MSFNEHLKLTMQLFLLVSLYMGVEKIAHQKYSRYLNLRSAEKVHFSFDNTILKCFLVLNNTNRFNTNLRILLVLVFFLVLLRPLRTEQLLSVKIRTKRFLQT